MRENIGSVTPPRTSNKPQLKTSSYALIVFLSGTRLSFIPAPRYSFSCSVTCNGETNALFIPPVGDTNTSFPVTWHRGNRKLGQMGDWLEQLMQTLKLAPTKHSLFVKKRWNIQRKLWCTDVYVPDSWCLGNKVKESETGGRGERLQLLTWCFWMFPTHRQINSTLKTFIGSDVKCFLFKLCHVWHFSNTQLKKWEQICVCLGARHRLVAYVRCLFMHEWFKGQHEVV